MTTAGTLNVEIPFRVSPARIAIGLAMWVLFLTILGTIAEYWRIQKFPLAGSKWFFTFFDLDGELNIPAWYSTFALLTCSALLALITRFKQTIDDRFTRYWRILAYIFLYLGFDELLSIHEILIIPAVRDAFKLSPVFHQTWVIPGAVLVLVFAFKYWRFWRHLPRATQGLFVTAAIVYIGGALGMEMVGGALSVAFGGNSMASLICVVLEEALEMFGVVIFIYGLLGYVRSLTNQVRLNICLLKQ
jgi:hypothetical protein